MKEFLKMLDKNKVPYEANEALEGKTVWTRVRVENHDPDDLFFGGYIGFFSMWTFKGEALMGVEHYE